MRGRDRGSDYQVPSEQYQVLYAAGTQRMRDSDSG